MNRLRGQWSGLPLPEWAPGTATVSAWRQLPPSSALTPNARKSSLLPIPIGHAKWEPINLPERTQVVNLTQRGRAGGQEEATSLSSALLAVRVPVSAGRLYDSSVCRVGLVCGKSTTQQGPLGFGATEFPLER